MSTELQKDKHYKIQHQRKGTFYGRCVDPGDGGEWATFEVTHGVANAVLSYNVRHQGDDVTVRKSFSVFSEMPQPDAVDINTEATK